VPRRTLSVESLKLIRLVEEANDYAAELLASATSTATAGSRKSLIESAAVHRRLATRARELALEDALLNLREEDRLPKRRL